MHKTDWFYEDKWGVFTHYLSQYQNSEKHFGVTPLPWNDHVNQLDVNKIAEQLHEVNAGYFCITIMQLSRYLCVPSKRYEEITGFAPLNATPERDIVMELYEALSKYDIDLMLYFTGDGPMFDDEASEAFGYKTHDDPVTMDFVYKWASVLEELAVRYGTRIKGWWLDGCHPCIAYDEEKWKIYADAIHKGNPDAIIAFNASIVEKVTSFSPYDDYTAGERSWFDEIPKGRFIDDKQWHIFTYLGYHHETFGVHDGWCGKGCRFTKEYVHDFVERATERGGVVTLDVRMDRYGNFEPEQFEVLKTLKHIREKN